MTNDPKISAILLAAGLSRRAGAANKLIRDMDDQPMVCRSADNLLASNVAEIVVVTGHEQAVIQDALAAYPVRWAHNSSFETGMATSISAGIGASDNATAGALICLADMPHIQPTTINRLIDAFDPANGAEICVPVYEDRRGNPALFARRFFDDLCRLEGDRGGKVIINAHPDAVVAVGTDDPGIHIDHDTID